MPKIMIVDDEPSLLGIMQNVLTTKKYDVIALRDSGKAKQMIESEEEDFDLLLSDVRMSPVDGMELLRCVKETRPKINVIMITAYFTPEKSVEACDQGAYAYIAKPFSLESVLTAIQSALASSKN